MLGTHGPLVMNTSPSGRPICTLLGKTSSGQYSSRALVSVLKLTLCRFHGIYWPAFLLALDLPLPRTILAHGHWTINREKMSKSIGNVVNPNFAIERFGVDAMRYFLAANGSLNNDPDYDNSYIVKRYKADLSRGLGNLTSRLLRGKLWNVRQSVECRAKGMLPARSELDEEHEKLLVSVRQQAKANMDNLNLWRTIDSIVSVLDKVTSLGPFFTFRESHRSSY